MVVAPKNSEGGVVSPSRRAAAGAGAAVWVGGRGRRPHGAEEGEPAAGEGEAQPGDPVPAGQDGQAEPGGGGLKPRRSLAAQTEPFRTLH